MNPGILTPYTIELVLKETIAPDMQVRRIMKDELNAMTPAQRIDTVLSTDKLAREGIVLPEIRDRLRSVVLALKDNLAKENAAHVMRQVEEETKRKLALFDGFTT